MHIKVNCRGIGEYILQNRKQEMSFYGAPGINLLRRRLLRNYFGL